MECQKILYKCDLIINIPTFASGMQLSNCVELIKSRIGIEKGLERVSNVKGSSVIFLTNSSDSEEALRNSIFNSIPNIVKKLSLYIQKDYERKVSLETIKYISSNIENIERKTNKEEINKSLKDLNNKIDILQKTAVSCDVEIFGMDLEGIKVSKANIAKHTVLSFALGIILSITLYTIIFIFDT